MALENFILGFRLGMRMAMEALDEDDGSWPSGGMIWISGLAPCE